MEKKYLLCVYDFLKKNNKCDHLLSHCKYIGEFISEPIYFMFYEENLKNAVIVKDGDTCINFEVYEINETTLKNLEFIYSSSFDLENQKFIKKNIETPYGDAIIFMYNKKIINNKLINSGNFVFLRNKSEEIKHGLE